MSTYSVRRRSTGRVAVLALGSQLVFALIAFSACILLLFGSVIIDRATLTTVTGTVEDKYVKRYNDADYFHVVVRYDDGSSEVFQNRDTWAFGKFNSADVQASLKVGQSYTFQVCGYRIPFLSMFRNIVQASPGG